VGGVRVLRELARRHGRATAAIMPVVFTSTLFARDEGAEAPADEATGGGIEQGEAVYGITQTPQVWLDHQATEQQNGGLSFNWDAVEDLFPSGLLDAMFEAYCGLLRRLSAEESAWSVPLGCLVPLAHLEFQAAANATAAAVPAGLLHERVWVQARQH